LIEKEERKKERKNKRKNKRKKRKKNEVKVKRCMLLQSLKLTSFALALLKEWNCSAEL